MGEQKKLDTAGSGMGLAIRDGVDNWGWWELRGPKLRTDSRVASGELAMSLYFMASGQLLVAAGGECGGGQRRGGRQWAAPCSVSYRLAFNDNHRGLSQWVSSSQRALPLEST